MCIQVIEYYAHCRCIYYKHSIDPCSGHTTTGHKVTSKKVSVGYSCSRHSSSSVDRHGQLQPRRGHTAQRPELETVSEQAPHTPTSEKHTKSSPASISRDKPEHRESTLLAPVLAHPVHKLKQIKSPEENAAALPTHIRVSLSSQPMQVVLYFSR